MAYSEDLDTVSFIVLYTDDSVAEIEKILKSKEFYLTPDGKLTYSAESDTVNYVLQYLTGE